MTQLLAALVLSLGLPAAQDARAGLVRYRGHDCAPSELPAPVSAPTREVAAAWAPWAAEHEYRMELSSDERALLIVRASRGSCSTDLALIAKVGALLDRIAPLTEPTPAPAEASDHPSAPPAEAPDSVPAVLLELRNAEDEAKLVDHLLARHAYLAEWAPAARGAPGFVLEQPLAAAWLAQADGLEEWSPEAELVHRCAQLFLLRRYGRQPYWLTLGLAWYAESEIRHSIWCFPYRDEFVFATEHTDWDKALAQLAAARETPALTMERVASLRRGAFDRNAALVAWGAARWLAEYAPAENGTPALSRLLAELRAYRDEHGRRWIDERNWVLPPEYEVPVEAQAELLARAAGADALAELQRYFAKPRGYERGR